MDDVERLLRSARPESGSRDRPLSARAERELEALVGERIRASRIRTAAWSLVAAVAVIVAVAVPLTAGDPATRQLARVSAVDPASILVFAAERGGTASELNGVPQYLFDKSESDALLTLADVPRSEQARVLLELAASGRATRAVRGQIEGNTAWFVTVDDAVLIIDPATGTVLSVESAPLP